MVRHGINYGAVNHTVITPCPSRWAVGRVNACKTSIYGSMGIHGCTCLHTTQPEHKLDLQEVMLVVRPGQTNTSV